MIESERLVIRPLHEAEREAMVKIWLDPVNERLHTTDTEDQVRRWVEGVWGIWERETGELVGDSTLFFAEQHGEWELAYGLRRNRWGRGYATEAAQACVNHGFEHLALGRIVADVEPENQGSIRVLKKVGFIRVGGSRTLLLYAVSR